MPYNMTLLNAVVPQVADIAEKIQSMLVFLKRSTMSKEEKDLSFHNENVILLVARWSKIVSWGMIAIYLLRFISDLISVFAGGQFDWPPAMMDRIMFVTSLVSTLFFGSFYFLVLQGVAQGLYLGLDMSLNDEMEEEA